MDKCHGQATDGTQVCGYRERCARYITDDKKSHYVDFWKAGDDCPKYESILTIGPRETDQS